MSVPSDIMMYKDSLIILTVAGAIIPLMHRFRINAVVGFLAMGALLGPQGLVKWPGSHIFLDYITISNDGALSALGDLGVVFLLFLIGVELSVQRLITMRLLVFGLGTIQVVFSALIIIGISVLFGLSAPAAILTGAALSLSSTAIVIQVLSEKKRLKTSSGRISFSILLFQDLAVIPILFLVGALSDPNGNALLPTLGIALIKALVAVGGIVIIARMIIQPLFRQVAATKSSELFVATTLLIIIGAAVGAAAAGVSMALGAFVAGLVIAETEYNRIIRAIIDPFKGLLLGIFFFTVGMGIDLGAVLRQPLSIVAAIISLIILKGLIIVPSVRWFGFSWSTAIKTALLLGPAGEFAFIIIGLARESDILTPEQSAFILAVSSLSMACIPFLSKLGKTIDKTIAAPASVSMQNPLPPLENKMSALVIGFGRVGQFTSEMLERHNISYIAIDRDPHIVETQRKAGRNVYYGDAQHPGILRQCGLMSVKTVIITGHTASGIDNIVRIIRDLRKDVPIISRAHDSSHAKTLYALGVTYALPEAIEASLQLSEAALIHLDIPQTEATSSIQSKREKFMRELKPVIIEAN
jgi:CPA2 family monovalent cation:H+ antiporter-2